MTILVTGATGFLGGALAAELIASRLWPRVLLLVRAANVTLGRERMIQTLRKFAVPEEMLGLLRPEQILCADLSAPASPSPHEDPRLRTVTQVIHCAAVTSFGASQRVFTTNVAGTLRFAKQLRNSAAIERFVYVSTAMICGSEPEAVVREDDHPRATTRHLVHYTQSKAHAETLLRQELPDFPLIVARPSIIVGHTQLGCQPSSSIFWTFRMADALRMITSREDGQIDIVPVDYAARALILLLTKPALAHTTYHISAASASSCRWTEIAAAFDRARGATEARATRYRTVGVRDVARRKPEFNSIFGPCNTAFMMRAIRLYGAFAALNCVFANDRLREEGVTPSPRFSTYLDVCLRTTANLSIAEQMLIDF